METDRGSSDI